MSGFFNTASGFTGQGFTPNLPFTNTFNGDVSGIMNHPSGGGGTIAQIFGLPVDAGINGFISGYLNTGSPANRSVP